MKFFKHLFVIIILVSCSNDDDLIDTRLSAYLINKTVETGAVIACAGSDESTNNVLVFYYPEIGAANIGIYETKTADVNKDDFSEYSKIETELLPFFNGYLGKIIRSDISEKWIIITYEIENEIKISNPIKTKQFSKPTIWSNDVVLNQEALAMPLFTWQDNAFGDNAIYFQVISDMQDNLLSGTYTFENHFQYYNTTNVVLNITIDTPPVLVSGALYNFTLMDVSEDNWVNTIIQKNFVSQ